MSAQYSDASMIARAAANREDLNDVRQGLVAARGAVRDAETDQEGLAGDQRAFAVREALADWAHARAARGDDGAEAAELDTVRQQRDQATRRGRIELHAEIIDDLPVASRIRINGHRFEHHARGAVGQR